MMPNYDSPGMLGHYPKSDLDRERGYTLGEWKGLAVYRCIFCPQDLFREDDIVLHVFTRHTSPKSEAVSRPAQALLFDEAGRKIEEIPIASGKLQEEEAGIPDDALFEALIPDFIAEGLPEDVKNDC